MTKDQLFDTFGDIKPEYILAVSSLLDNHPQPKKSRRRIVRTIALLAAALALLTLTVFAAEYWDFGRRLIRSETAPPNSQTLPQTYLSLSGIENSPESMAVAEWLTFRDHYINQKSADGNFSWRDLEFQFADRNSEIAGISQLYGAWDKPMYDELLSIAKEHSLTLHTSTESLPRGKTSSELCIYENGAFTAEGYIPFHGEFCYYLVRREEVGTMPCEQVILFHTDNYREEQYVTTQKETVQLAIPEGSGMGLIFFEDGNAFLSVEITLRPTGASDWSELLMAVADTLDFRSLCQLENSESIVSMIQPDNSTNMPSPHTEPALPTGTLTGEVHSSATPILRIQPRVISVEQVKQAAKALFGTMPMYEYSSEETKGEIKELISAWEYGITDEAIREFHGDSLSDETLVQIRSTRQKILDYYLRAYPHAREDIEPVECLWTFWPSGHYDIHNHDYQNLDIGYTDDLPYGSAFDLKLTSTIKGIPYLFSVTNREAADFRYHGLSVYMNTSYYEEEHALLRTMDINTEPITQEEIDRAEQQMKQLITAMGLGEFEFTAETYSRMVGQNYDEILGDVIMFTGVPCYAGLPVLDYENMGAHISIPGLSNCYPETLTIHCTRSGELIMLNWNGAMEMVEVVEENCTPMTHEDVEALAWPQGKPEGSYEYPCPAYVGDIAYTRIRENDVYFLLIPTVH